MEDVKAIEALWAELEMTRLEQAALTDAIRLQGIRSQELTQATNRLADLLREGLRRRGFWARLAG